MAIKKFRPRRARPSKKAYKKRAFAPRKRLYKKKFGPKHITVESKGIMTTYSKDYLPSSRFGKMMQKKYWVGARTIQVITTPYVITTIANRQANYSYQLFNTTDIYTMLTADNQQGGAIGTVKNTNRFFLNNCLSETLISNNNNFPVEITCYRMTAKKDTDKSPSTCWTTGVQNENASALTDLSLFYGISPMDSVRLVNYFNVKRVTHITLQAGGTHNHRVSIDLNRVINNEYIQECYSQAPIIENLADITTTLLWVVRAYPQQSTATAGSVQQAIAVVNFTSSEKYTWKYIADATTNIQYTQAANFGAAVSSTIFNIGSGANVVAAAII